MTSPVAIGRFGLDLNPIDPDRRLVCPIPEPPGPVVLDLDTGERFTVPIATGGYNQVLLIARP